MTIRREGTSELVAPIRLTCIGGKPTSEGEPVPKVGFQLFFNATVTNPRAEFDIDGRFTFIDNTPLVSNFAEVAVPGDWLGARGVNFNTAFDPADPRRATNFEFWNVRVNATEPSVNSGFTPAEITALISATGLTPLSITNPFLTVAVVKKGVSVGVANPASVDPADAFDGTVVVLKVAEEFPGAAKTAEQEAATFQLGVRTDLSNRFTFGFNNFPSERGFSVPTTNEDFRDGHAAVLAGISVALPMPLGADEPVPLNQDEFVPLADICPDLSDCSVTYEVTGANPDVQETFRFPIRYVRPAGGGPSPFGPATTVNFTLNASGGPRESPIGGTIPPISTLEGYAIAQANFDFTRGFKYIQDGPTTRVVPGYFALNRGQGEPWDLDQRVGVFEVRALPNQSAQLLAEGATAPTLILQDGGADNAIRFNLTSEGYLPRHLVIGAIGPVQETGFTVAVDAGTTPGPAIGQAWLDVEKVNDETPLTLIITVDPQGLAPGTYRGTITLTASRAGAAPLVIPIALEVPPPGPRLSSLGVANTASFASSIIAPGEAVSVFGTGFGPDALAGLQLIDGVVATEVSETRILFDGEPAPMIFSISGQAAAFVPFSIEGKKFVMVEVEYQGVRSPPARVAVLPAVPALFTADQSGGGPGAILNQDNSFNSVTPAKPGEIVQLFGVGGGQTTPPGRDGRLSNGQERYNLPIRVFLDGVEVQPVYAGPAPGLVEGVFQVNIRLPDDVRRNARVRVLVYFGDVLRTQPNVTVWIE